MIKKLIIFIMNLFLIICTFCLLSITIFSKTILDEKYALSKLEETMYYEKIYDNIQEDFKNYILQSGLEEKIFENICSMEKVKSDINLVIGTIYKGKNLEIDVEPIKNTLEYTINDVLAEKNRKPNSEEKEAIKTFEKSIIEVYINNITYAQKYIEQIGSTYAKTQKVIEKINMILIASISCIAIIIIIVNRKFSENFRSLGVMVLTVGILSIGVNVLLTDRIFNILILNKAFSELVINVLHSILNLFMSYGIIFTCLGGVGIILGNILKIKNKEE